MKIDVELTSNAPDDASLSVDQIDELITSLQNAYKSVRSDMYSHFLSTRILIREMVFVGILYLLYLISNDNFYIYFMPVSILISFIGGIFSAEFLTKKTRDSMKERINHYLNLKKRLQEAG